MTLAFQIRVILSFGMTAGLISCSSGSCLKNKDQLEVASGTAVSTKANLDPHMESPMTKSDSVADRVKVYKYDGSLQCAMGKAIPLEEMQKELKDIKVYSAKNKHDGLMHIMVCGSPTGKANVYEIDRVHLQNALKKGFKEWTFD